MKDNNTYIDLMIASCRKAAEYIAGLNEEDFSKQSIVQSAVIMQLQVIGEMAKKLDEKIKSEIDVPWGMIIGLRNIIAHDYFMLDLIAVWEIVTKNVPVLEEKLLAYLEAHGTSYIPPFDDTTPLLGE